MERASALTAFVATVVAVAGLGIGSAHATDQGIKGKKLFFISATKFVVLSKDPSIKVTGSHPEDPGSTSTVSFDTGGTPVVFALADALWRADASGQFFRYRNRDAPSGPSAVASAKVGIGVLRVVGKGLPFPVPSGDATVNVVLSLDGGTNRYCMSFSGPPSAGKFLVKDAPAGTCPP